MGGIWISDLTITLVQVPKTRLLSITTVFPFFILLTKLHPFSLVKEAKLIIKKHELIYRISLSKISKNLFINCMGCSVQYDFPRNICS